MDGGRGRRAWLIDALTVLPAAGLGVFFLVSTLTQGNGWPLPVEIGAGLVAYAALMVFRRSRPVGLTLWLIPLGVLFGLPMGATPVALFAVALYRRARVVTVLAVLHAATIALVYLVYLGPTRTYVESVVFVVLLHVSVVAIGLLVRSQRLLVRSWADRARQAEEGQRLRVEQARLAERERIAREMHDVLAHRISLLAVHAGALEVRREAPAGEREAAGVIRRCAYDALEDLRQVIGMLRDPADTHPQPTLADVPALVEQSREAGAAVSLELAGLPDPPAPAGRHVYRIVQEALTNARKHAPGAAVRVAIDGSPDDGLVVEVGNRLPVVTGSIPGAGVGLAGLGERVRLAGGRLDHGPTAGGDFQVRAWLPWRT